MALPVHTQTNVQMYSQQSESNDSRAD